MTYQKLTAAVLGLSLVSLPVPAAAQFGGLAKKGARHC